MKVTNLPPSVSPGIEPSKTDKTHAKAGVENALGTGEGRATGKAQSGANVEISDKARMMQQASQIAKATPDIRSEKVAALKKSIADGTYKVDSGAIADRLVDEHLSTDFGKNGL